MLTAFHLKRKSDHPLEDLHLPFKKKKIAIEKVQLVFESSFEQDFPLTETQNEIFRFWDCEEDDFLLMKELFFTEPYKPYNHLNHLIDFFSNYNECAKNEMIRKTQCFKKQEKTENIIKGNNNDFWTNIMVQLCFQNLFNEIIK